MDPIIYQDGIINEEGVYAKFLQIYLNDNPILLIGSRDKDHPEILKEFFETHKIDFQTTNLALQTSGPKPQGANYKLVGGGYIFFLSTGLQLVSESGCYKIGPNPEHAKAIDDLIEENIMAMQK